MNKKRVPQKKGRRARTKYPGLVKNLNKASIQNYIDFDYIDNLSDTEKKFLSDFVTEYYSADFRNSKLIKNKKGKREVYRNNNSRNNDLYTREFIYNRLDGMDKVKEKPTSDTEDKFIKAIDLKSKFSK